MHMKYSSGLQSLVLRSKLEKSEYDEQDAADPAEMLTGTVGNAPAEQTAGKDGKNAEYKGTYRST